ncbi:MAG: carbohydrate ABC transporter permease [Acutalibacteraceae bacterium]
MNNADKAGLLSRIKKYRHSYALITPFFLICFVFTVLPVVISIALSFTDYNMLQTPRFVGFTNYVRLILDDKIMIKAVNNTLVFAFVTGPISYFLCLMLAWLINDLNKGLKNFFTVIFYAPSMCSAVYVVWSFLFSSDSYGYINSVLMKIGIINEPIAWLTDPDYIMFVLIIVQLWMSLGTGFLAFIAGLQGIDHSMYEAGVIDGIPNRFYELWYITLPSMVSQLTFGAVMQIVGAFSVGQISISLAGFPSTNYAAETVLTHIIDYGTIRYEMGYASAMATVLFAAMFITQKLSVKLLGKIG